MNVFVYPPVHGFGLGTLFQATQRNLPSNVAWTLASQLDEMPRAEFDLAHLYTLPDVYASFQNLLAAQRAGLRVVATAVYWNPTRYLTEGLALATLPDAGAASERETQLRAAELEVERAFLRVIYQSADVLVALSPSEADALVSDFDIARERILVAWCGVETRFANASPKLFQEKFGLRDFVLCVGRVDANKNQLQLIRALRDTNVPLVLAGGSLAPPYLALCQNEAGANVHFLPALTDEELGSAYAAAHTHALASWLEVVGLVTLEAAVAGCNVTLTRTHGARDYVGEEGWYCDPAKIETIRAAVLNAQRAPRQTELREKLLKNYSWANHAETVARAYTLAQAFPPQTTNIEAYQDALCALAAYVPMLQETRAELWREKTELAQQRDAYANGRVMRALNTLQHVVKR